MEWNDIGYIISIRPHGESSAVVSVLTREHGRYSGYVKGAFSKSKRGVLDLGNEVYVRWVSRVEDQLGHFDFELIKAYSVNYLNDPLKLYAIQSACALADQTLAERERHEAVYEGFSVLLQQMASDVWAETYIFWELALIRELGFGLDFRVCAATGNLDSDNDQLAYVSPKTGRAVSLSGGEAYKDKLLPLPPFLIGRVSDNRQDIVDGLRLTQYFLENRIYSETYQSLPEPRQRFFDKFVKTLEDTVLKS